MKVGIITFNRAINYGAVLQSLALKDTIKRLGYQCEIVNYKCEAVEKGASPFYINSGHLKDILIFLFQIRMRIEKNKKFKDFSDKYLDTNSVLITHKNIEMIKNEYDYFITGSDQVWNYEITGLDKNYFLDFVADSSKCISYAASFGISKIPVEYREKYKRLLNNIGTISVREEEGLAIVKQLVDKDCTICIDPVFLFNKSQWKKYEKKPNIKKEYILVYSINKSECYEVAKKISKQTNLQIVGIQVPMSNRDRIKKIQTESPEEFLGLIDCAKYVVTDSFHGTAFSLIFNKQFVVCCGGDAMSRISRQRNLLNMVNLENRICSLEDYSKIFDNVGFDEANIIFEKKRELSIDFLKKALI